MELDIIYEDEHLVAINKPSGLLVHRSEIDRHETAFALQLVRNQLGQRVYPVHRLDKPTSGVLVFARQPETASLAWSSSSGASAMSKSTTWPSCVAICQISRTSITRCRLRSTSTRSMSVSSRHRKPLQISPHSLRSRYPSPLISTRSRDIR